MKIFTHQTFDKHFSKRIAPNPTLVSLFNARIKIFRQNVRHPLLKARPLKGAKRGLRAFSVTGDIRVVYRPVPPDTAILLDVGTHNQVY